MKILPQSFEILQFDDLRVIELAARNCYKSEDKIEDGSAARIVLNLVKNKHLAMIEFGSAAVRVITDRAVTHEWVRHRLFSYAQESQRYCNYSKDKFNKEITYIEQENADNQNEDYLNALRTAEKTYFALLDAGWLPQIARSVLPNATKTEIICKANFREWLHFFELRTSPAAHPQIRKIAKEIQNEFRKRLPEIFS
ncbi:MAG: FAD-dependent thymidylate synthase [Christensenellaceae bacterium]|jgi:thymidylate synthase (FAD)|nr:FAD-dependent thymidylate synthase [Christensenellaceae bacterium]